jgi:hypothetical protein
MGEVRPLTGEWRPHAKAPENKALSQMWKEAALGSALPISPKRRYKAVLGKLGDLAL